MQGEQITTSASLRNTEWDTHNCVLGYPVIGEYSEKSERVKLLTAFLRALVLFCFPCDLFHNTIHFKSAVQYMKHFIYHFTNTIHVDDVDDNELVFPKAM